MTVHVATFYKLVPLAELAGLQRACKAAMVTHGVTGTILVTPEGINGTVAGPQAGLEAVLATLRSHPALHDLTWKLSIAPTTPFQRAKVKVKREVIPLGHPTTPDLAGAYVAPADWNALIANPRTITIDTRNDYEVKIGRFDHALNPQTRTFKELPGWLAENLPADRSTPIAMYCTGGIRCEKSTAYLRAQGYTDVYHLEGGILKYLEAVPASQSLWRGDCYVFDDRVAVDHQLQPATQYAICPQCNSAVNAADWRRNDITPCPQCRSKL